MSQLWLRFLRTIQLFSPGNSTANGGASNTRCGDLYSVPCGQAMSIFCDPRVYGQYVYVRRPGVFGVLSLCEAAVYSESRRKFTLMELTM